MRGVAGLLYGNDLPGLLVLLLEYAEQIILSDIPSLLRQQQQQNNTYSTYAKSQDVS